VMRSRCREKDLENKLAFFEQTAGVQWCRDCLWSVPLGPGDRDLDDPGFVGGFEGKPRQTRKKCGKPWSQVLKL
jgi:hypothetical protein